MAYTVSYTTTGNDNYALYNSSTSTFSSGGYYNGTSTFTYYPTTWTTTSTVVYSYVEVANPWVYVSSYKTINGKGYSKEEFEKLDSSFLNQYLNE